MAIKINQNIFSLLVQRNLNQTSQRLEHSFNRLSSGQRINRAADDPAGMATSEQLRYEIQGLRQNQQNVTGAFSLIGTAESALDQIVGMLQRARELVVQGGNDTLAPDQRQAIQTELNQLLEEIDRTASTSRYGQQQLLNGDLQNVRVQVGTSSADAFTLTLGDFRVASLGAWAMKESDATVGTAPIMAGDVTINGVAVEASQNDGVSLFAQNASAIAKANAINAIESQTGVHAEVLATEQQGVAAVGSGAIDGVVNTLQINGINIGPLTTQAGDANGVLVNAINAETLRTGVEASIDASGRLVLTAPDGRNVEVHAQGNSAQILGLSAVAGDHTFQLSGKLRLTSEKVFELNDPNGRLGMTNPSQTVNPDPSTALATLSVSDNQAANDSLLSIDAALAQISAGRTRLGSVFNRLDDLSSSLTKRIEDLTASDSRIRDTDFALETANLTQQQILRDAAVAMLAQANVTPRRALELLQG